MPLASRPAPGRLIKSPSSAFCRGLLWRTQERAADAPQGRNVMDFGLLRLSEGQRYQPRIDREIVLILLHGKADVEIAGESVQVARESLFDEGPTAVQCGAGSTLTIVARSPANEWAVLRVANRCLRGVRWYFPGHVTSEDRGAGLAQDACRRTVRTLFDHRTCRESGLVVGEVVNRAGRWSSYPPHHHLQAEIYHYRFTLPQGYGHAELGERVLKVRDGDTVEIPGGLDHAQVAAPGYGMYYLWAVRHLPRRPYRGFKYTADHAWLLDAAQQGWVPPTPSLR